MSRVLIAEDDAGLRRLLELQLVSTGYSVRTAFDGVDALEIADDWHPELLLCDVMMPRVSGLTVCRELRARQYGGHIPIILLTARVFDEDIEQVMQLGGITFMGKPFSLDELKRNISRALSEPWQESPQLKGSPAPPLHMR